MQREARGAEAECVAAAAPQHALSPKAHSQRALCQPPPQQQPAAPPTQQAQHHHRPHGGQSSARADVQRRADSSAVSCTACMHSSCDSCADEPPSMQQQQAVVPYTPSTAAAPRPRCMPCDRQPRTLRTRAFTTHAGLPTRCLCCGAPKSGLSSQACRRRPASALRCVPARQAAVSASSWECTGSSRACMRTCVRQAGRAPTMLAWQRHTFSRTCTLQSQRGAALLGGWGLVWRVQVVVNGRCVHQQCARCVCRRQGGRVWWV